MSKLSARAAARAKNEAIAEAIDKLMRGDFQGTPEEEIELLQKLEAFSDRLQSEVFIEEMMKTTGRIHPNAEKYFRIEKV